VAHFNVHLAFSEAVTVASSRSFALAASFCTVLCISHLSTAAFIAWKDLTGSWSKYALCKTFGQADRSILYIKGLLNFIKDVGLLLLPCLIWPCTLSHNAILMAQEDPVYLGFFKMCAGYTLGRLWAALAHRCLHMRPFYKWVHKRHHVRTHELVATGAWLDHPLEYMIMEMPSLVIPLLFFPTKLAFHYAFFFWHGFSAATDHSGFTFTKANGACWFYRTFFDSEYHYYHHKVSSVNYAEMEWIDYLCGTHHSQKLRAKTQTKSTSSVVATAFPAPKLPSTNIRASDTHVCGPDHCCICLNTCNKFLRLWCNHTVCEECATEASAHGHDACPLCRVPHILDPDVLRNKAEKYREGYRKWRKGESNGANGDTSDVSGYRGWRLRLPIDSIDDSDSLLHPIAGIINVTRPTKNATANTHIPAQAAPPEKIVQAIAREVASGESEAFYVVDLGAALKQLARWRHKLPNVEPHYAVKCNPDPALLLVLAQAGVNFDCASQAEIEGVLALGVDANRVLYANAVKHPSQVRFAASAGVPLTVFDNESELSKLSKLAPKVGLLLRIAVDDSAAACVLSNKFGAPLAEAEHLLGLATSLNLKVVGVSFHIGSSNSAAGAFAAAVERARAVFDLAERMGNPMTVLDVGGGFPGTDTSGISFDAMADALRNALMRHFSESSGVRFIAEPGRFFAAQTHTLAVNIIGKAVRNQQTSYYVNDGLYGSLNCVLYDHVTPECRLLLSNGVSAVGDKTEASDELLTASALWGPTCDGIDKITGNVLLPALNIGDWLYFPNMGAYTRCAGSTFNGMPLPKVVYMHGVVTTSNAGANELTSKAGANPASVIDPENLVRFRDVWYYAPQCIDYIRLLLCLIANFTIGTNFFLVTAVLLTMSAVLDHFDGRAARYFNQCTVLGDAIDWSIDLYTDLLLNAWWSSMEPSMLGFLMLLTAIEIAGAVLDFAMYAIPERHPARKKQSGFCYILEFGIPGGKYNWKGDCILLCAGLFVCVRCCAIGYGEEYAPWLSVAQKVLVIPYVLQAWCHCALLVSGLDRWREPPSTKKHI